RVCEKQIERGDRGQTMQNDLARSFLYLCRAYRAAGRRDDALDAGRRSVAIYRTLVDRDPSDSTASDQLYLAHAELGFVYQSLGRWDDLIACRESARSTLKAAATKQVGLVSRVAAIQGNLAVVDYNLALAYASDPVRYARPLRATVAEAYAICDKLS